MVQANPATSAATDIDPHAQDLGPLAWVLEEVRKSLDAAGKSFKRYAREVDAARTNAAPEPDAGQLRLARQQLHQAAGALLMVGQPEGAHMAEAMESAGEKLLLTPALCTEEAAAQIERGGFALAEYLDGVLAGKSGSPVALFPQYRDAQTIAGADRVHPADLWPQPWHWQQPQVSSELTPLVYDVAVRGRIDPLVLRVVKSADPQAARELHDICLALAMGQTAPRAATFLTLAAAYFEAVSLGLLSPDLYTKRAASRVLLQYTTLAKGDTNVSERLAHDLLFFCAQAVPAPGQAPTLTAVRAAWRLDGVRSVNYMRPQYGLFDPALLAQARKRIEAAKELWSGLSGGDATKLRNITDAFSVVSESLLKIYPPSAPMAQALTRAVESTVRTAKPPPPELAMEVATSVLYLEAAFEDLDPADPQLETRARQLADRLEGVRTGGQPQALENWMEELYRRVSDRQTMGTVVGELRTNLGELEKAMDAFFRNPAEKGALRSVPGQLSQMRGVLSVLGLDQATQAVLRMRDSVEQILVTEVDEARARAAGTFDKLGNNLGALGFLVDMLNYQPALAKKLFVFDAELGELKPLMGRQSVHTDTAPAAAPAAPAGTAPADAAPDFGATTRIQTPPAPAPAADARPGPAAAPASIVDHGDMDMSFLFEAPAQVIATSPDSDITTRLDSLASQAELADQPALARTAQQASAAIASHDTTQATQALEQLAAAVQPPTPAAVPAGDDLGEDDLQDIFLEEAREVVQTGRAALDALAGAPEDLNQQTTLRRAFHTLKGSSRMVGLTEFGEAAWSMEQVLNAWLAEQKPVTPDLLGLAGDAMTAFADWIEDIASGSASQWRADSFRAAGDAMRLDERRMPIGMPAHGVVDSEMPHEEDPDATVFAGLPDAAPAKPVHEVHEEPRAEITAVSIDVVDFAAEPLPDEASDKAAEVAAEVAEQTPEPDGQTPAFDVAEIDPAELDAEFGPDTQIPDDALDATRVEPQEALVDFEETRWPDETMPGPASFQDTRGFGDSSHGAETLPPPADALQPAEVAGIDFESVKAISQADVRAPEPEVLPENLDEQTKVIGNLRISIPLYNVYLNEADEWSRRLVTEVNEWSMELHQPVTDNSVALAHSLAGSSATVGFKALSSLARALEAALQHVQLQPGGTAAQAQTFIDAAEEVRRLLHQFAAGFLKEPSEELIKQLSDICATPVEVPAEPERIADDVYDMHAVDEPEVLVHAEPAQAPAEHAPAGHPPADTTATPEEETWPESTFELTTDSVMPDDAAQPQTAEAVHVEPGYVAPAATFTAPVETPDDEDEVIDAQDAVDADLFPIFEEEAVELLPKLGGAIRQWASRPEDSNARVETLRNLHTLKGSARLAGALRLGEMAHRMESRIEQFGSQETPPAAWVEALLGRFDTMQNTFEALRVADEQVQEMQAVAPTAAAVEPAVDAFPIPSTHVSAPEPAPAASPGALVPTPTPAASAVRALITPATNALAPLKPASSHAVRVRSQLLDRLVTQAGEVIITRSRLESELGQLRGSLGDLTGNLDRLRQQLRDIELQAESQMQSRLAQAKDLQQNFDPLEFDRFTRVQELTRMMAESVNDVATVQRTLQRTVQATEDDLNAQARQTRELQRDLLRTRMVEFEGISERLYRVVRQASKDAGKQVKLDITGGSIEMDRGVLDRMTPAFEHLLRNCVAHGVETPDVRTAAGKDASGTILVDLRQEGNDVSVEFRDDGAGLNLERIREKALSQGLITADQELSEQDAAQLIFMPGFSTATQVSELAGRGIGMDVVRSEVNALGGRIETHTVTGQGSSFRLVLPLTTAVTQVVMLRLGTQTIGVPSNLVELVRRANGRELEQAYNSSAYPFGGEEVPFFWAGALLQASARSVEPQSKSSPVVVFKSASQRVALHVDEVLGNQEVVVKNLGPQLARLPGLAGMTVLSTGAVLLIYNPVALAAVYGTIARSLSADHAQPDVLARVTITRDGEEVPAQPMLEPTPPQIPLVLVVDDSITVRRVTQRLLQREGYRVSMAADGLQALERLQEEQPAVVLSDIEMPRMDGFDLARNIRNDTKLKELPIIMITSRIAEKHREHAMALGVNHYLGKPYSEEELLSLVRRYTTVEQPA